MARLDTREREQIRWTGEIRAPRNITLMEHPLDPQTEQHTYSRGLEEVTYHQVAIIFHTTMGFRSDTDANQLTDGQEYLLSDDGGHYFIALWKTENINPNQDVFEIWNGNEHFDMHRIEL